MAVDEALPVDDFADGFQLEIAAHGGDALKELVFEILACSDESVVEKCFHAHACLRKARCFFVAPVGLLHVFAEGKLDPRRRVGKFQSIRWRAVAEFDDLVLPANGIGRAMQEIGSGESAGELAINVSGF